MKFTFDRYGAKSLMESNMFLLIKKTQTLNYCAVHSYTFWLLHFLTNQNERYIISLVNIFLSRDIIMKIVSART